MVEGEVPSFLALPHCQKKNRSESKNKTLGGGRGGNFQEKAVGES